MGIVRTQSAAIAFALAIIVLVAVVPHGSREPVPQPHISDTAARAIRSECALWLHFDVDRARCFEIRERQVATQ